AAAPGQGHVPRPGGRRHQRADARRRRLGPGAAGRDLGAGLAAAQPDRAVDGAEPEPAAAVADGALEAPGAEASRYGDRELRADPAVHGGGLQLGAEPLRQLDGDAAVDRVELEGAGPVGAAEDGVDGAVDRRSAGEPGGGDADGSVDGGQCGVARQVARFDLAVDGGGDEAYALRDAHDELDHDAGVPDPAVPAPGPALVGSRRVAARVDGADGDAVAVGDDLDGHALGVAAAPAFDGRD